jgi:hypothetical protein
MCRPCRPRSTSVGSLLIGSSPLEGPSRTIEGKQLDVEGASRLHGQSGFNFGSYIRSESESPKVFNICFGAKMIAALIMSLMDLALLLVPPCFYSDHEVETCTLNRCIKQ